MWRLQTLFQNEAKLWFIGSSIAWFIFGIFVWLAINITPLIDIYGLEKSQSLYLLSSTVQSLAAIFAIVITVSIIIAQISSQYGIRMITSFLDKYVKGYIILFIISILLPLVLISQPELLFFKLKNVELNRASGTKIYLWLSAGCLFYLLPYMIRFRDRLNPESLLNDLKEIAEKKLIENAANEPEETIHIYSIALRAYDLKDLRNP